MDKPHKPTAAEIDDMMCAHDMQARERVECDWCNPEPCRMQQPKRPDVEQIKIATHAAFGMEPQSPLAKDLLELCEYVLWLEGRR